MKNGNYLLAGFCLLISTQAALAQKQEMEQHGSHEHGAARLTVATTDDGLEIALESPAANIFGFEHNAKTSEERAALDNARDKLGAGSALFSMTAAAACSFDSAVVESAMIDDHDDDHKGEKHDDDHDDDHKGEKHDDDHDDDHKGEKHDDDHDDDHKGEKHDDDHDDDHKGEKHDDDHDDDHKGEKHDDDHDDHKGEGHSDVDVTWVFKCKQPAALKSVSTKLFSAFPGGFEALAVEWITASSSGKTELKKDDTITLKQ